MRAGHLIDIGSHFIEQSLKRERESGGVGVWSEIYCSVITINVI